MLAWLIVLVTLAKASAQSLFLFSGQSNMDGMTTNSQSAGGSTTLFEQTVAILNSNITDEEKSVLLQAEINRVSGSDPSRSAFEAQELLELSNRGLIQNITSPMANAFCSFIEPWGDPGVFPATHVHPYAGCGRIYGHELMFAHSLASTGEPWSTKYFSIEKLAREATLIEINWLAPDGTFWPDLMNTIHNTTGTWEAFVWHQGESDVSCRR